MADRLQTLTTREVQVLTSLGPHTRGHAVRLLARWPRATLTSGRRSASRNAAVGGSPRSFHLAGRAVDVVCPDTAYYERVARWARADRFGPRCSGPEEVIKESDHLHIAW